MTDDSIKTAIMLLINNGYYVGKLPLAEKVKSKIEKVVGEKQEDLSILFNTPIDDYIGYSETLGDRAKNRLKNVGILTVGQLAACTIAELRAIPQFGQSCLIEVKDFLSSKGLHINMPEAKEYLK